MKNLFMLMVLSGGIATAQIGAKVQQQAKITGLWQNNQFGYTMALLLKEDKTGEFDGEVIRYAVNGTTLAITQAGAMTNYTFALQANTLTLSGGDLDQPVAFTRYQSQAEATPTAVTPQHANDLVGLWTGNGESIEFKENKECVYLRQSFAYEVSNGHVTLKTSQGNLMMAYAIQGNQLTLTLNGKQIVYQKGAASGSAASATGAVAQELVGKWCWVNVNSYNSGSSSSSTCITLQADGTYEYYSESSRSVNTTAFAGGTNSQSSDRGTWWVNGERIYYQSPTQGQGSYRLQKQNHPKNGDPMIVLDGEPYVTFYNKSPWR